MVSMPSRSFDFTISCGFWNGIRSLTPESDHVFFLLDLLIDSFIPRPGSQKVQVAFLANVIDGEGVQPGPSLAKERLGLLGGFWTALPRHCCLCMFEIKAVFRVGKVIHEWWCIEQLKVVTLVLGSRTCYWLTCICIHPATTPHAGHSIALRDLVSNPGMIGVLRRHSLSTFTPPFAVDSARVGALGLSFQRLVLRLYKHTRCLSLSSDTVWTLFLLYTETSRNPRPSHLLRPRR
jgi:hypothetical protein